MTTTPKYPGIHVPLVGQDGNAFNVLAICQRVMREAGLSESVRAEFTAAATSGDYNTLLRTVFEWFAVDSNETDGTE